MRKQLVYLEPLERFIWNKLDELKGSADLFDKKIASAYEKAAAVLKASCSVS